MAAVGLHVAAGAALLAYEPARSALLAAAPLMVEFIVPPKVEPAPPVEIVPPKPKPQPKPKPRPIAKPKPKPPEPPVVATPVQAPSPVSTPAPPELEPAPESVVAPPLAPPPPVQVTAPIFNADYLKNPPPAYPALSRRIREEGRVILRVLVNASGSAAEVQVRDSSGHPRLDEAAQRAVQSWRFVPARRGEEPVAAWVLVPVSFRLEG
jgi:protein TonB